MLTSLLYHDFSACGCVHMTGVNAQLCKVCKVGAFATHANRLCIAYNYSGFA